MIDFLIIGGTKCGSTSLADYVAQSSRVNFCKQKEPALLNQAVLSERDLAHYRSLFDSRAGLKGEATPAYSDFGQVDRVITNLRAIGVRPKIILSVRNQVKRIESTYLQRVKVGAMAPSTTGVIDISVPGVLNRGKFGSVLAKYHEFIPADDILVLNFDKLILSESSELKRLKIFLNLESDLPDELPKSNPSVGGSRKHWIFKLYKDHLRSVWQRYQLPSLRVFAPIVQRWGSRLSEKDALRLTPEQVRHLRAFYEEDDRLFKKLTGWSYWDIEK